MLYLCSVFFWLVQASLVHTYEVERGFETADCACVCACVRVQTDQLVRVVFSASCRMDLHCNKRVAR